MRTEFLDEPELQFGASNHIDIRFGLMNYGPFDVTGDNAPRDIRVGIVGTPTTVEGVREWLSKCEHEIAAKESKQPNLFPRFPGFNEQAAFRSKLSIAPALQREIPDQFFEDLKATADNNKIVVGAVDRFLADFRYLKENAHPISVLICAVPPQLAELMDPERRPPSAEGPVLDFHDLLKARGLDLPPIQLVLPGTYDPAARRKLKIRADALRPLQDEATRAWNIHTALYYKAGGLPWRIVRDPTQFTTCYMGVSFYKSLDGSRLITSMAQVFDERGEGMVVKGAPIELSKDDRIPHIGADDADRLLAEGLARYREMHGTQPARIVVHKTSQFNAAEIEGFRRRANAERIEKQDLVSITKGPSTRLFREGQYPPLRGTMLSLDDKTFLLYTRGSVDFYRTYPGLYIPRPLVFRCDSVQSTPKHLAKEILALTKMNWNMTQFDGSLPITVEAARNVGAIFKYLGDNDSIAKHYRHYM